MHQTLQHWYINLRSIFKTLTFNTSYLLVMENVHVGQWHTKSSIKTGMSGGLPLTIFDKAMENTVVISPFREFMATSSHLDTSVDPYVLQLGVFGKANKVYTRSTVNELVYCMTIVGGIKDSIINNLLGAYLGERDSL